MPLNSIKTQLHHYLRDLAIYQAWRTLGITFIFFKVMGFFSRLALSGWLRLIKGAKFSPSQNLFACILFMQILQHRRRKLRMVSFSLYNCFFFQFLAYDAVTLLLHSLWKKFLCEVSVSCLHFEKWAPKCGITEISIVITVAQKTQHD